MPMFTLARNYVLVTLAGRSIEFIKNKPTHVPPECVRAAVAVGAIPADGSDPSELVAEPALKKAPTDALERQEKIGNVIRMLIARNDRDDFSASGLPNVRVVEKLLDWKVDKREIQLAWSEYCNEQAEAQEQLRLHERERQVNTGA